MGTVVIQSVCPRVWQPPTMKRIILVSSGLLLWSIALVNGGALPEAGSSQTQAFHFENDIVPILSRYGCNASGCHGSAEGQNGFKLSVFGSDPAADYAALVKEGRGRRVLFAAPEHSLVLLKVSGAVAHGGGIRIRRDSEEFATLKR